MHAALIKRKAANLAPAGNGRGFWWYREALDGPYHNAGIAPDGTNTAAKLVSTTATAWHKITAFSPSSPKVESGRPYTFSIFLKSAGWRYVRVLYEWASIHRYLDLDLLTGAYVPASGAGRPRAYRVETLPDGWYRVSITEATSQSDQGLIPAVALIDKLSAPTLNIPGDGTSGILLWGYQINPGGPAPYNPALPPV